jgi:hypothetical protein
MKVKKRFLHEMRNTIKKVAKLKKFLFLEKNLIILKSLLLMFA